MASAPDNGRATVRERTRQRVARDASAATTIDRTELEKTYKIKIVTGDRDWSEGDLADLSAALGKLSTKERAIISGYDFQRWTTRAKRGELDPSYKSPPGAEECGLHELTLGGATAKISMCDGCFDPSTTMAGQPIGSAVQRCGRRRQEGARSAGEESDSEGRRTE